MLTDGTTHNLVVDMTQNFHELAYNLPGSTHGAERIRCGLHLPNFCKHEENFRHVTYSSLKIELNAALDFF